MANSKINNSNLDKQFQAIFGGDFKPYGFQRAVAQHLLNGRNVILQAPTGAGKTKAALFSFLCAKQDDVVFPRKLLYSVPMRVLAKSFYTEVTDSPVSKQSDLAVRIQTGENQDDRQLRGNVIFTTIDQVLSSFLNIPYALGLRQGNVNAGAVVGSYLVFDEFHLFDPDTALPTVIEMLKMLNGIAPFLLMTATFSRPLLKSLAERLNAEIVKVTSKELKQIPSQRGKRREYRVAAQTLVDSADLVISQHQRRSIVICNSVIRAQAMYQALQTHPKRGTTVVLLLHSRFLKKDRQAKEDMVRERFKRGAPTDNVILVATQVIEVGLDITCENLHTELAPASAIFQRAGRCARFENEAGTVTIYPLPLTADGSPNYHPYADSRDVCEATWKAFQKRAGGVLDFIAEQKVINEVHGASDKAMLAEIGARDTRHKMSQAISGQEFALARDLIRGVDSRTVLVHDTPEKFIDPFRNEGFSLYRGTLFGQFKPLQEQAINLGLEWALKYPVEVDEKSANSHVAITYEWRIVTQSNDMAISPLVVVHPRLAAYDIDLGFRFEVGDKPCPSSKPSDTKESEQADYKGFNRETYTEHIEHLLTAYQNGLASEMAYAAAQLEPKLGALAGTLDRAVRLCIALHDVGKLTTDWQRWAHEWQRVVGEPIEENYMAAHTDYDLTDPSVRVKEKHFKVPRPPHAVESMRAVAPVLVAIFGKEAQDLTKACLTAIARHHAPRADKYKAYELHTAAQSEIAAALQKTDTAALPHLSRLCLHAQPTSLTNIFVQPDDTVALLTYFLIVRALRLADQWATSQAGRKD